jgi:metal-dependent amidase/aminoacylase/carboxypeptidase family protein
MNNCQESVLFKTKFYDVVSSQHSDNSVLTIGQMHGGNTSNIIPDTAFLSGTIRTFSKESREFIKNRLVEISKGIASTFRASAEVEYSYGCPSVVNDAVLREEIMKYSTELLGEKKVPDISKFLGGGFSKISASEDFAYVTELVPSTMVALSAGSSKEGYIYPQHHPKITFDESPLYIGTALYANTAIEWLKNNKYNNIRT